ncbi:MAG: hypothetical protein RJB66_2681 [Pseudomonadota bacterium]
MIRHSLIFFLVFVGIEAVAVEEDLNLDKITELSAPVVIPKTPESKYSLMGRMDLTLESNPVTAAANGNRSDLKNWHGLRLFLKLKASAKTHFFGEVANQDFYYVDYKTTDHTTVSFGKIIVPFGDTRYFHHFYGGIQGKGATGIMFPNVWAESGVSVQTQAGRDLVLDTYVVNGFKASSATTFPDLNQAASDNPSGTKRQALGARLQWQGQERLTVLASGYLDVYWDNRRLSLLGLDAFSDYGFFSWPIRFGLGVADATAEKIPQQGTLHRRGDYILLAGNDFGPGEWRLRYGTYNHITKTQSDDDSHSFDMAYIWNIDVIRMMIQRQWNFESQNEKDDDLWRLMTSIDF